MSACRFCTSVLVAALVAAGATPTAAGDAVAVRVGTYDSRAIAIAWAASSHNPVRAWHHELEAARRAGDMSAVRTLERRGRDLQRQLHFQGFGRVPVDDLLAPVADGVKTVAARHDLAVIGAAFEFRAPGVVVVDVTDDLVALFEPSDRTRASTARIRGEKPVSLLELAAVKAEH